MKTKLPVKIEKKSTTYKIELNADRFERVAAALGMFSKSFLSSLETAEKDIKRGHTKKLKSLSDLM